METVSKSAYDVLDFLPACNFPASWLEVALRAFVNLCENCPIIHYARLYWTVLHTLHNVPDNN